MALQTRLSGILIYRACLDGLANKIVDEALWKNRILRVPRRPFFSSETAALLITIFLTELRQQELTKMLFFSFFFVCFL